MTKWYNSSASAMSLAHNVTITLDAKYCAKDFKCVIYFSSHYTLWDSIISVFRTKDQSLPEVLCCLKLVSKCSCQGSHSGLIHNVVQADSPNIKINIPFVCGKWYNQLTISKFENKTKQKTPTIYIVSIKLKQNILQFQWIKFKWFGPTNLMFLWDLNIPWVILSSTSLSMNTYHIVIGYIQSLIWSVIIPTSILL